jgi:acetamidase/formamidase
MTSTNPIPRISALPLVYEFSRHLPARVTIASGDRLLIESEDALSAQISSPGDQRDKALMPKSNPVNGPIEVRGAEPGDVLEVTIHSIQPWRPLAATYTGSPKQLCEWLGTDVPPGGHVCPIADGVIHWSDEITIPYAPMLGCIGTAPEWGVPTTGPAGPHGGNMDIRETAVGAIVHLPVLVPGGQLFLGDAHAAMGHGELSATGLEMSALTEISVVLKKNQPLAWPRIENEHEIMVVTSGAPAERTIARSYAELILWMENDFGWDRWKAYDLLTHVGDISVGYYDGGSIAAKVNRTYL